MFIRYVSKDGGLVVSDALKLVSPLESVPLYLARSELTAKPLCSHTQAYQAKKKVSNHSSPTLLALSPRR